MTVASQVKQVLATLKGSQGTIRLYAGQTQEDETRAVYDEAVETTEKIIHDLEKRLSEIEYQEPQYKGNCLDQAWQDYGGKPPKGKVNW